MRYVVALFVMWWKCRAGILYGRYRARGCVLGGVLLQIGGEGASRVFFLWHALNRGERGET